MASAKEVFQDVYRNNAWGNFESRSGPGSTLQVTRNLVIKLPMVFDTFKIKSVLDLPCGDFNWMRTVAFNNIRYIGADIVDDLIISNQTNYPDKEFVNLDLLTDRLPKVDLIICRDCLGHFPTRSVRQALFNICESKSKYLLTTNFPDHSSEIDIKMGEWRPINLMNEPFNLPEPLLTINEGLTTNGVEDKSMSLWAVDSIKLSLLS